MTTDVNSLYCKSNHYKKNIGNKICISESFIEGGTTLFQRINFSIMLFLMVSTIKITQNDLYLVVNNHLVSYLKLVLQGPRILGSHGLVFTVCPSKHCLTRRVKNELIPFEGFHRKKIASALSFVLFID